MFVRLENKFCGKKKIVDNIENKNSLRVYDEFLQLS